MFEHKRVTYDRIGIYNIKKYISHRKQQLIIFLGKSSYVRCQKLALLRLSCKQWSLACAINLSSNAFYIFLCSVLLLLFHNYLWTNHKSAFKLDALEFQFLFHSTIKYIPFRKCSDKSKLSQNICSIVRRINFGMNLFPILTLFLAIKDEKMIYFGISQRWKNCSTAQVQRCGHIESVNVSVK